VGGGHSFDTDVKCNIGKEIAQMHFSMMRFPLILSPFCVALWSAPTCEGKTMERLFMWELSNGIHSRLFFCRIVWLLKSANTIWPKL